MPARTGFQPPAASYRGTFGAPRPAALHRLALPPAPMPGRIGTRPLKAWRYVAVCCEELIVCAATVRVGPARQSFWVLWDRRARRLRKRTALGRGPVRMRAGAVTIADGELSLQLGLDEGPGVETVSPTASAYAWTRKQAGVAASGTIAIDGDPARPLRGRAMIDDTAAYFDRRTAWRWCAGVGTAVDGRPLGFNFAAGVHDDPRASECTVWVDGVPEPVAPVDIDAGLRAVGELRFAAETVREHAEHRVLVRVDHRQPLGTFAGRLPNGIELADGFGVMEAMDARW